MNEEQKEFLANTYGEPTKQAIKPLTALLASTLGERDLVGYIFIREVVNQIMEAACQIADDIREAEIKDGVIH